MREGENMPLPLRKSFFVKPARGRPGKNAFCTNLDSAETFAWLTKHKQQIARINYSPLAWYVQAEVRRWWVYYWDLCVDWWKDNPDWYPEFPWFKRVNRSGDLPPEDGKVYLMRGFKMLMENPLVTPSSIEGHGLHLEEIGDLSWFFRFAHQRHIGEMPDVQYLYEQERCRDSEYTYLKIANDIPIDALGKVVAAFQHRHTPSKWKENFEMYQTYEVLALIDLRIAELLSGLECSPSVKAQLIWGKLTDNKRTKSVQSRHRAKTYFSARDLQTTATEQAKNFLSEKSAWGIERRSQATRELLILWQRGEHSQVPLTVDEARKLCQFGPPSSVGVRGTEYALPPGYDWTVW
jgi:hypothetical protein